MRRFMLIVGAMAALAGCPSQHAEDAHHGHDHGHDHGPGAAAHEEMVAVSSHGEKRAIGQLTVGGHTLELTLLGEPTAGKESGLEAHPVGAKSSDLAGVSVYAWLEDSAGKQLSPPDKAKLEGGALHFHLNPRADSAPSRVVVRVRGDGVDERAGLPLSGHGHEHEETPHSGVVSPFLGASSKVLGHLELKLHDDKGDLELWLAHDADFDKPFDLPLTTSIRVQFIDLEGREIELRPRNNDKNEDEDGNPNVREGRTNYFVFPGGTGADSTWLMGVGFNSLVTISFTQADGTTCRSEEFMLTPHVHAE
ncbi:MAG: hypothetical protein ACYTFT_05975 [Planctomycetota bacterium]